MTKPYSRMELNSPGVRPPLEWERVNATVEALEQAIVENQALPPWVGPCAHGRDPWDRCDTCGEGRMVWALFEAWATVVVQRDMHKGLREETLKANYNLQARIDLLQEALKGTLRYLLPPDYPHFEIDYDSVAAFEDAEAERKAAERACDVLKETTGDGI